MPQTEAELATALANRPGEWHPAHAETRALTPALTVAEIEKALHQRRPIERYIRGPDGRRFVQRVRYQTTERLTLELRHTETGTGTARRPIVSRNDWALWSAGAAELMHDAPPRPHVVDHHMTPANVIRAVRFIDNLIERVTGHAKPEAQAEAKARIDTEIDTEIETPASRSERLRAATAHLDGVTAHLVRHDAAERANGKTKPARKRQRKVPQRDASTNRR